MYEQTRADLKSIYFCVIKLSERWRHKYLTLHLFPLHLQIYWYSTAYTPPTLVSPRNELLTRSNPFSWSWVKLWKSCDRVRQQNRQGKDRRTIFGANFGPMRPGLTSTTWHFYRMKIFFIEWKYFLSNENILLNENIFLSNKNIFIEWKYIFI